MGAVLAMLAGQAAVAQASKPNNQQEKMTTCNADAKAKGLKGDERKAFMKTCLSGAAGASATAGATGSAAAKGSSQQEKMKSCNADAKTKGLKGADRKAFMKDCLSGAAAH
jgi:hypothetical protein